MVDLAIHQSDDAAGKICVQSTELFGDELSSEERKLMSGLPEKVRDG